MKRIVSWILALVLLVGSFPAVAVHATDTEEIPAEEWVQTLPDEEPEEEPTETLPGDEVTEETEEVPEEVPGEEPTETIPEEEQIPEHFTVIPTTELPDNEELFAAYAQQKLYGSSFSMFGAAAGERLSADVKLLYDALVPIIKQIASGERTSTTIGFGEDVTYMGTLYAADVALPFTGSAFTQADLGKLIDALMADLPYEMYWYDKTTGCPCTVFPGTPIKHIQMRFEVADNYQGAEEYAVDTAKTGAATAAAENAEAIVAKYADKTDYEKLLGYKEEICSLVSYDKSAAGSGVFASDNDPWQLIHVFDGSADTNVVCEGYSKAFMYLCDLTEFDADVSCYTVTGNMNGAGHMWNVITLEGKHYLADVTNSDSGTSGADGRLFLAGAEGTPAQGYTISGTTYTYDSDTLTLWGSDADSILTLADSSFVYCAHVFGQWAEETAPTCTEKGSERRNCENCNYYETRAVAETGHSYTDVVTAPTCTEAGYTTHTCSSCGDTVTDTPVEALGHTGGTATCKDLAVCTRCEEVYGELDATNHVGGTILKDTADATCAEDGYTGNTRCLGCDAILVPGEPIPALGHSYTAVVIAPTCTEAGYTTHTCAACGDTYADTIVDALGHAWDAGVVTKESTLEETGIRTFTCTVCGEISTEEIPCRNHPHDYTAQVVNPTYTKKGYTIYTCVCGETYQSNYTNPKGLPKPSVKVSNNAKGKPVLTWTDCSEAKRYDIYRATSKSGTYKKIGSTTTGTYTDTKASQGKTYYYKVKAIASNSKYNSTYSTYDKAYSKCATPTVTLSVSTTTGKPTIKWKKVSGAKKYTIYRATSQNGSYKTLKTTTSTSYTDTSAKVGTTYYYKVKAIASGSTYNSAYSAIKSCVPICAKPKVTISINSTTGKPLLKWGSISGAVGYQIYRAGSDGEYVIIADNYAGVSFADKEAKPDTDYQYKVRAIGKEENLNSKYSTVQKVHTTLAKPAVRFSVDAATGKPTVQWDAVEGAQFYRVYRSASAQKSYKLIKSIAKTAYTDTSVSPGKSYYYKVVAVGENSKSAYSTYQKLTAKCGQPVTAVVGAEGGGLTVSWKKVTGAKKYEVYRRSGGGDYKKIATVSKLSYADTKAPANQVCYYKVRAYGDSTASRGAFSATVSAINHTLTAWKVRIPATTEADGLRERGCTGCDLVEQEVIPELICSLKTPTLTVSTNSSTGKPSLSWKAIDKATGYYVYLYDGENQTYQFVTDTTKTSYVYPDGVPGCTYSFSIVAVSSKYCSQYSAAESVVCKCATPKLTLTRDQETDMQILSWKEIPGAQTYEVYLSGASGVGYQLYTTTAETSVQIGDVPAGIQYYYKVRAIHPETGEADSVLSSATTQSRTVSKLVIYVGSVSEKSNMIAWEKVKNAKYYNVYRATGSGSDKLLKKVYSTEYVDVNVKSGTEYTYRVRAYDSKGKLLTSSQRQTATEPNRKPVKIYLSPSSQIHNTYRPTKKMNTTEAVQCRSIAKLAKTALERCGFEVKANVTEMDIEKRVKESNNWGSNLHVPIHTNAFNGKGGGTQVYHDGVKGSDSYKAAEAIYNVLAPLTPGTSRESLRKHNGLYENNASRAPVAFIEAEYHDSYQYAKWIVDNKDVIAEAICKGICNYYGVPYIEP